MSTVAATTSLARSPAPVAMSTVTADGLVAELYRPAAAAAVVLPGVILLGGSEGGLAPAVSREAELLAGQGYVVLQLGYFGAAHLPETLQLVPLEYFEQAVDWLRSRPDVDPARIGIIGTSIGGETALLVAAHDPAITAVVAAVPSDVVWQGLGGGISRNAASSFTLGGRPLPDLPLGWAGVAPDAYARYAGGLAAMPQHAGAIIPVEDIRGPVMLICGERDRVWPSCRMATAVVARLKAMGFRHPVLLLDYPEAGHAVFGAPIDAASPDYAELGSGGGSAADNEAARRSSWTAVLAFLSEALNLSASGNRL